MKLLGSTCTGCLLAIGCSAAVVKAPAPASPTELVHVSEQVVVDCVGSDETLSCSLQSSTRVANRGTSATITTMDASTSNGREVRLLVDDKVVAAPILGGDVRFPLAIAPGHERTVSIKAEATLRAARPLWTTAALVARHPWLSEDPSVKTASVRYCPSARGSWAQSTLPAVTVYGPARWAFDDDAWLRQADGNYTRLLGRACDELRWRTPSRATPIYHGGPIVGVGGTFGEGLRLRLGYEAGIGSWLVGSLYGETNADDEVVVAPVMEAVADAVFVLPSVGAGIGVPLRVAPDTRAGIRGQVTIMWGFGASFALDYYPTDEALEASLLGQFGF